MYSDSYPWQTILVKISPMKRYSEHPEFCIPEFCHGPIGLFHVPSTFWFLFFVWFLS
jgi:hypothetical protein